MKVELTRKDILTALRDLEEQLEASGNFVGSVSVEVARAALKRIPEFEKLTKVVYVSPLGHYMDVLITTEDENAKATAD